MRRVCLGLLLAVMLAGCGADETATGDSIVYTGERLAEFDVNTDPGVIERTMDGICAEGFTLSSARQGYRLFATCLAEDR